MNVIIVDTSSWISYFKGIENRELDRALSESRAYLSPIVLAELLSAKISPKQKEQFIAFAKELPPVDQSFEHWIRVGELRAKLFSMGLSVSTPDAHIAQCGLDLDCYVLSEDLIFQKVSKVIALRLLY